MLTDQAALMGAHGVKVAKQNHRPLGVSNGQIPEDLLAHVLGPAVGVGTVAGLGSFPQWHLIITGVNGCGRREDDSLDTALAHHTAQGHGGAQVVFIVLQGLGNGLTNSLQAGKMNGALDCMLVKNLVQQCLITDIALVEGNLLAGDHLHAVQALRVRVDQVINDNRLVTCFNQFNTSVAADIAGAAGNQNFHFVISFTILCISSHCASISATSLN